MNVSKIIFVEGTENRPQDFRDALMQRVQQIAMGELASAKTTEQIICHVHFLTDAMDNGPAIFINGMDGEPETLYVSYADPPYMLKHPQEYLMSLDRPAKPVFPETEVPMLESPNELS